MRASAGGAPPGVAPAGPSEPQLLIAAMAAFARSAIASGRTSWSGWQRWWSPRGSIHLRLSPWVAAAGWP
jgi:hypothetical protein